MDLLPDLDIKTEVEQLLEDELDEKTKAVNDIDEGSTFANQNLPPPPTNVPVAPAKKKKRPITEEEREKLARMRVKALEVRRAKAAARKAEKQAPKAEPVKAVPQKDTFDDFMNNMERFLKVHKDLNEMRQPLTTPRPAAKQEQPKPKPKPVAKPVEQDKAPTLNILEPQNEWGSLF